MKESTYFESQIPKLAKFPVLYMPKTKAAHSLDVFPWQPAAAQKLVKRYLTLGAWIDRSIALADYYDVPIGHLEGDQPLILADLDFARRLTSQDIILWWSLTPFSFSFSLRNGLQPRVALHSLFPLPHLFRLSTQL